MWRFFRLWFPNRCAFSHQLGPFESKRKYSRPQFHREGRTHSRLGYCVSSAISRSYRQLKRPASKCGPVPYYPLLPHKLSAPTRLPGSETPLLPPSSSDERALGAINRPLQRSSSLSSSPPSTPQHHSVRGLFSKTRNVPRSETAPRSAIITCGDFFL